MTTETKTTTVSMNVNGEAALVAAPKTFGTTYPDGTNKVGFYAQGKVTIGGKTYQSQLQMIELRK